MNTVYYGFILVVGAALAQARCLVDVEKPSCLDITPSVSAQVAETVDCQRCRVYAFALRIITPTVHAPVCVADSSLFQKAQYDPHLDESFCVDEQSGIEYDGSRIPGATVDCSGYPAPGPSKTPCFDKRDSASPDFIPSCQLDGYYDVKQCAGDQQSQYCWCTASSGQHVPLTFHQPGAAVDCQGYRDFSFDCSGLEGTWQPYPGECARYIKCSVSGIFSCTCGSNMAWDITTGTCNHAAAVICPLTSDQNQGASASNREQ